VIQGYHHKFQTNSNNFPGLYYPNRHLVAFITTQCFSYGPVISCRYWLYCDYTLWTPQLHSNNVRTLPIHWQHICELIIFVMIKPFRLIRWQLWQYFWLTSTLIWFFLSILISNKSAQIWAGPEIKKSISACWKQRDLDKMFGSFSVVFCMRQLAWSRNENILRCSKTRNFVKFFCCF
jgi:hypothetical protein